MAAISSYLKLLQNCGHTTGAEFNKEPSGENRVWYLYSLMSEIIKILIFLNVSICYYFIDEYIMYYYSGKGYINVVITCAQSYCLY